LNFLRYKPTLYKQIELVPILIGKWRLSIDGIFRGALAESKTCSSWCGCVSWCRWVSTNIFHSFYN